MIDNAQQNLIETCRELKEDNARLRKLLQQHNIAIDTQETGNENQTIDSGQSAFTVERKIQLFSSLFRGRQDVYALRWESKSGTSGYSPACANEWKKNICQKPKIKCSACKVRQLNPLTNKVIYDHLSGKVFTGIYPLLKDETCYFLAIDFDKTGWRADASHFINTCEKFDVPAALEQSQSGNGAHVWIFFDVPVAASLARSLGTALITKTMQEYYQLSMDSYDRLFPNQDTMPKGGFGNLIALPLQGMRRKNGNSVFIDKKFIPYSNQWQYLNSIKKMSIVQVEKLLKIIDQTNATAYTRKHDNSTKTNSRADTIAKDENANTQSSLPEFIDLTLEDLIHINTSHLPSNFIHQLKKLASFHNPEFYKAQALRLSTYGKPRIISCFEDSHECIGLPRGCLHGITELCDANKVKYSISDKRNAGVELEIKFVGKLTKQQVEACNQLCQYDNGVLSATTGFGKTVIAANMIAERGTNTLILVHRQQLMQQWQEKIAAFLDISTKKIGLIGGGKNTSTNVIDIAILQTLNRKNEVNDIVTQYGHVIVDECHHISAYSFEQVLKKTKAKYILGLTATPQRKDGHHPIIFMQCGQIRYEVRAKDVITKSKMHHILKPRMTQLQLENQNLSIVDIYKAIQEDEERNQLIFDDVMQELEEKRCPLILTERRQHLEMLATKLQRFVKNIIVIQGGMGKKQLQACMDKLKGLAEDEEYVILATGRCIGEGFDHARLETLFLTMPISWQGTLQQYIGRLHRSLPDKQEVRVYDYVDQSVDMLQRMYDKRLKKYKAMGYTVEKELV